MADQSKVLADIAAIGTAITTVATKVDALQAQIAASSASADPQVQAAFDAVDAELQPLVTAVSAPEFQAAAAAVAKP